MHWAAIFPEPFFKFFMSSFQSNKVVRTTSKILNVLLPRFATLACHSEPFQRLLGLFQCGARHGHGQCGVQQVLRLGLQRRATGKGEGVPLASKRSSRSNVVKPNFLRFFGWKHGRWNSWSILFTQLVRNHSYQKSWPLKTPNQKSHSNWPRSASETGWFLTQACTTSNPWKFSKEPREPVFWQFAAIWWYEKNCNFCWTRMPGYGILSRVESCWNPLSGW